MGNAELNNEIQVLLVEDDRRVRGFIRDLVESLNRSPEIDVSLAMECTASMRETLDHLSEFFVDVILLDLSLPDVHGVNAITQIHQSMPNIPIVVLTNVSGWTSMVQCAEAGGRDYLVKNELDADMLFRSIFYAFERKQVEDQLRQSKLVYRSLIDHLPVGIFRKDVHGRYEYVNRAFCEAVGYEAKQIQRHSDSEIFSDQDASSLNADEKQVIETGECCDRERTVKTAQGKEFDAQLIKIPLLDPEEEEICGIQGVLSDITARRRSEEQRRQAERFAGMEALAGDIAHHVNNRLAPVMLNASIIESKASDPELVEASKKIGRAASKAGQIVRHLLAMAMQTEGKKMPVELDLTLSDLPRFVREQLSGAVQVDLRMPGELPSVSGEFGRLKEVLEELCKNACESMQGQGVITITAKKDRQNLCVNDETGEFRDVDAVVIQIKDNGPGIPRENRGRIFDPYFTTRDADAHEGMGLAQAMRVARSHNGVLRLDGETEKGACFELVLPAVVEVANSAESEAGTVDDVSGKTILLVDDEEPILEAAQVILEGNGFNVVTANDGAQAIAKFSERPAEINLVLTDLMMPYMDGAMLSKAIRDISTSVPIFVATGLDSKENLEKLEGLGIREVIPKPFAPKQLVQRICQELTAA